MRMIGSSHHFLRMRMNRQSSEKMESLDMEQAYSLRLTAKSFKLYLCSFLNFKFTLSLKTITGGFLGGGLCCERSYARFVLPARKSSSSMSAAVPEAILPLSRGTTAVAVSTRFLRRLHPHGADFPVSSSIKGTRRRTVWI